MAYQALYRQWRCKTFSEIVGQEAIVKTLKNQVATGRIAHAYLFCGSRGTGKTSIARILARAVNCENPHDGDPCGECPSCKRLLEEASLDVMEIDAASNNGVDEIRDLRENVKYPPQYGKYKVYIIDEVHMLSLAAFNALLKTLEEPPAHVMFILATTEPQKLPATILSRCQRYDFGRIPASQIAAHLQRACEGAGATCQPEALAAIARAAEGGMRDALSILDMCLGYGQNVTEELVRTVLGTSDKGFLFAFGDALKEKSAKGVMEKIDQLMRSGREPQVFAKDMGQHLRALLLSTSCPEELCDLLDVTKEDAGRYIAQAQGFSPAAMLRDMELFMRAETEMRYASSPRIAVEIAALKAVSPSDEQDVAALSQRVEELEAELAKTKALLASGAFAPAQKGDKPKAAPRMADVPQPHLPEITGPALNLGDKELWATALQQIKKTDPGLFSQLNCGTFDGAENNLFHIGFAPAQQIFVTILSKEARKQAVGKILTDLAGRSIVFDPYVKKAAPAEDVVKREQTIEDSLISTFGRDKVQIDEK